MIIRPSSLQSSIATNQDNNVNNDKKDIKEENLQIDSTKNIQSAANTVSDETNNPSKADEIKQKIDNGEYKIDIKDTADKMAQKLLIGILIF